MSATGYSGTPLPRKLGVRPGHRLALLGAPDGFETTLGELPADVRVLRRLRGRVDVAVFFAARRAPLERRFDALRAAVAPDGALWVAWPKRASGVPTDLTEDVVRELALKNRMVDTKVCAIDSTWSGLRLVIRLADRA